MLCLLTDGRYVVNLEDTTHELREVLSPVESVRRAIGKDACAPSSHSSDTVAAWAWPCDIPRRFAVSVPVVRNAEDFSRMAPLQTLMCSLVPCDHVYADSVVL